MMIPRYCDIVKKASSVFILLCMSLLFYHYIFNNYLITCQKYNVNESDVTIVKESPQDKKLRDNQINIYLKSNQKEVNFNNLKLNARQHQQIVDKERYGSSIDKNQNITKYCARNFEENIYLKEANENVGRSQQLVYFDFAHSFLFCQMQKIGSSTWNRILLRIRNIQNVQQYQEDESNLGVKASRKRHFLRDTMYNLPNGFSLHQVLPRLVTFTFTRHPFSRLVSAYNSKIRTVLSPSDKYYNEDVAIIQRNILRKFRQSSTSLDTPYPTPKEFIQYLIDEVKENSPLSLNPHFKPQYTLCPFCSVDFDFVGDLKYMKEDIEYLGKLLNIQKQVTLFNMNENSHSDFDGFISEEEFFRSVPKNLIVKLYENVYKPDFELLSYSYPSYYIDLGNMVME